MAGLLFWLIIATNLASNHFGYQTFGDLESEAILHEIDEDPRRFKIGFALIIIEHLCIISLAAMLFIAFNRLNLALAVVWLVSRGSEGVIQIVEKRAYWRLLEVARQFSGAKGDERSELADLRVGVAAGEWTSLHRTTTAVLARIEEGKHLAIRHRFSTPAAIQRSWAGGSCFLDTQPASHSTHSRRDAGRSHAATQRAEALGITKYVARTPTARNSTQSGTDALG